MLLVLLQKEEGLITATQPSVSKYTNATGFACPDTSPCNPAFSGFASQVYFAARQFQRYRAGVIGSYHAGVVNTIGYVPATAQYNNVNNARCGTAKVYIVNKATAALYDYTPYVPNAAALPRLRHRRLLLGVRQQELLRLLHRLVRVDRLPRDRCDRQLLHQPGRRHRLARRPPRRDELRHRRRLQPALRGRHRSWSPATGTHATSGAVMAAWLARGGPASAVGYPGGDMFCGLTGGGCAQFFQSGGIWWSPASGAHLLSGAIGNLWSAQGFEQGPLGYPTTDATCGVTIGGGCTQTFQNGSVFSGTTAGTHVVAVPSAPPTGRWAARRVARPSPGDMVCGLAGGCRGVRAGTSAGPPPPGPPRRRRGDSAGVGGARAGRRPAGLPDPRTMPSADCPQAVAARAPERRGTGPTERAPLGGGVIATAWRPPAVPGAHCAPHRSKAVHLLRLAGSPGRRAQRGSGDTPGRPSPPGCRRAVERAGRGAADWASPRGHGLHPGRRRLHAGVHGRHRVLVADLRDAHRSWAIATAWGATGAEAARWATRWQNRPAPRRPPAPRVSSAAWSPAPPTAGRTS